MSKTKLTLYVDADTIRQAKLEAERAGKSVGDLFTEIFLRRTRRKAKWSDEWGGSLGPLTEADLQRDDKLGHVARRIRAAGRSTTRTHKAKRA